VIGYRDGASPLHRAHPYTPLAVASTLLCLVFAASTPAQIGALVLAAMVFAAIGGVLGYAARPR